MIDFFYELIDLIVLLLLPLSPITQEKAKDLCRASYATVSRDRGAHFRLGGGGGGG